MRPITPQIKHSPLFKHFLKSFNQTTRETAADYVKWIEDAKEAIKESKKQIGQNDKALPEEEEKLARLKSDFLELSDKKQLSRVVEIEKQEADVEQLKKNKTAEESSIRRNEIKIEGWLKKLDDLKAADLKERRDSIEKHEAEIARATGPKAVKKLIKRRFTDPFEELSKYTVDEIATKPDKIELMFRLFHKYGEGRNRVGAFPGSEAKDFPMEAYKKVQRLIRELKTLYKKEYCKGFLKVHEGPCPS